MCGGDDHLAWKGPVSSEACRGLRTAGGIGPLFLVLIYLCGSEQRRSTFRIRIFTLSLGIVSWIRVEGRLVRVLDTPDMDQQVVTVDQFTAAMASIQEALASLRQEIGGQQGRPPAVQDETPYDSHPPPPPPPVPSVHQASPYVLHGHSEIAPPVVAQAVVADDTHARMDRIEQCMRQMRVSDGSVVWDDFGGMPVASLPAKFRMPDIERYTGVGCPRLHLRLYSTVMRAHGLDEPQMITLFPLSLSGAAQRWFASLESSRRRTWDDLAQEFLRQFSFNTVVDVSRRELEALRQRTEESVSSFISRWRGKIAEIVDRPSERDQIQMVLRSLQLRIARHVVGVPFADFGSLVMALYDVEDGISRGLWADSSPGDVKGKKPFVGPRPTDVSAISFIQSEASQTPSADPTVLRASSGIERPPVSYTATGQPCYAAQFTPRPAPSYPRPRAQQTSAPFALRTQRQFSQIGMPLSQALRKLTEAGLLTALAPRPLPQPIPAQFRMDLHSECDHKPVADPHHTCSSSTAGGIHFLDFDETDNHVHMLSWDDPDPEPIMPAGIYETSGVTLEPQMPAPFRLVPEAASVQAATSEPLAFTRYSVQAPYILIPDVEEVRAPHVDISQTPDVQYILRGGRVVRQPPPAAAARPLGGTSSQEEVRAEDDEILRQLQSTQARISIWSLLASSSTHRDALTRALSQIRVDTTTTPEGLIHMMTAGRATCIAAESHLSFLDNGSALNVCPLATAIALGYAPSDFGPSTQTVRAYDSTRREVMGTLEIELLIGPATFVAIFQVLRIPTSFNLLLGRPWIHRAGAIPSSLHQKVKFIHDGQIVVVQSVGDMFIAAEPVLEISHTDDDLFLTGFTFDEVQTMEIEDFCRDFVAMSFDQHGSTVVLDIMRSMSYLPGMGLGRRQHGPSEFIAIPDHDVPFGLGFIPTEADYLYMARLRKERVRARLTHTPFYYPLRPYTRSLADYFVRASEPHAPSDGIVGGLSTTQEAELQRLVQQLRLRDGAPGPSTSMLIAPSSPDRTSLMTLSNHSGYGIGVLLISPHGDHVPRSVRLAFSDRHPATNNIVEYEACILGLETALELGIRQMEVFGDSNLVLRQIQGEWKTRDAKLRPYHAYLELLVTRFEDLRYTHLPRAQNQFADALATLASMIDIPADATVRPLLIESRSAPAYCCLIDDMEIDDGLPWYHDIYHFLRLGVYPEAATAKDRRALRQLATRFVICGETLYRRSPDGMLLLCLDRASADRVMREFVQRCPECQIHGDLIHVPPSELHALTSPWPFSVWGIDIIGKISPKSSSGHEFILVAIDYFTKWVEAASYARLTSSGVASFIRSHIICRYGVPHELISDRGVHFRAEVDTLVQRYSIRHHRSTAYRPQTKWGSRGRE
ncbi:Ribonuclease HI [Vitis vinifera]|uniref:Ribonuclease HI n=1 Tax=Vitis vinifera TaxID=29760 RepID=A0A438GMW9_VITVI|nr:Ribonuclease HI [Vitis vinifera]